MDNETKGMGCIVAGIIGIIFVIVLGITSVARVDAGEICITTSGGAVQSVEEPGWNLKAPWKSYKCYNGRVIVMESVADRNGDGLISREDSDSQADYITPAIGGKSVNGLDFEVSWSLRYQITPEEESISRMYKFGAKNTDQVNEKLVKETARRVIPEIVNTYSADELYLGNLNAINVIIGERIQAELDSYGIDLLQFGLKKPNFVDSYEQAIADKALKVEEAEREKLAQELESQKAETLRIQTDSKAAAERITAQKDADVAIIAANAEAERVSIAAQADADRVLIAAEADAAAVSLQGEALAANPEVLQWENIQAIRDANIIYLPSDSGVLPIMEVGPTPEAATPELEDN